MFARMPEACRRSLKESLRKPEGFSKEISKDPVMSRMEPKTRHIYEFGPLRIDGSERQLSRNGEPLPLPPKAFDVLLMLIENHGRIVTKDELMKRVWPDTFVEDANLTVNIAALRKVLGKGKDGSNLIVTVPKYGYRFVGSVVESSSKDNPAPKVAGEASTGKGSKRCPECSRDYDDPTLFFCLYDGTSLVDAAGTSEMPEAERATIILSNAEPGGADLSPPMHGNTTALTGAPDPKANELSTPAYRRPLLILTILFAMAGLGGYAAYRYLKRPTGAQINSIAVLPFQNMSADANAEYLSDGMTENLINRLSKLSGLRVASRSSSFRYKGTDQDAVRVGGEMNVNAVLTGSIKQLGEQLIIEVSLDDVRTDQHIWGEQYAGKFSDILTLQNQISQDVTSNLRLKLTGADELKLAKKDTENSEAYQLYLKGNYEWNKHTESDVQKAIVYYQQALEKDPNYALAYAGLSGSYGVLGNVYLPPNENFPKAKAYAEKALALDDTVAHSHTAMGAVRLFYDWDWAGQEKDFKRAQEVDPRYPDAHQLYAAYLETVGRFDEARTEAQKAHDLDPLNAMFGTEVGIVDYMAREYDRAIPQFQEVLALEPNYDEAYQYLGQSYEQKGMYAEAIATFQKGMAQGDRSPALIASVGHAYAVSGDSSGAAKALADLHELSKRRYISPYLFAVVCAGLGKKDEALSWLEKAFQDRASLLIWLKVEPQFDPLRADPRFKDLVERIGLNK